MELFRAVYRVREGVVFWYDRPIPKADPGSFVQLGGHWARDAKSVFVQDRLNKGVDITTFEYLNPVYAKDAHAVFDWTGRIKGADPETVVTLDPGVFVAEEISTQVWARGFARDAHAVYYHDQMFGRASALRGADPATFVSLRNDYGFDAGGVWCQKSRLPKADPKTWVYLGRHWSMDSDRLYYGEREVMGIKRSKFTVVNAPTIGSYATDGHRYFGSDVPLSHEEFWDKIRTNFGSFERRLDVAIRNISVGKMAP